MSVKSRRFFGPTLLTMIAGYQELYVVPAGRTAVVRLVMITPGGSGAALNLTIGAAGAEKLVWNSAVVANVPIAMLQGMVLNPGDRLAAIVSVANVMYCSMYGSLLDGAPV